MIASVAVEKALFSFDALFDYLVPAELEAHIAPGKRVLVQFGRGSRKCVGMVFSLRIGEYEPQRIKKIGQVIDELPVASDELLTLAGWLRENTFCTYYDAVRTVIPAGMGIKLSEQYALTPGAASVKVEPQDEGAKAALLSQKNKKLLDEMLDTMKRQDESRFLRLRRAGLISIVDKTKTRIGTETVQLIRIAEPTDDTILTPEFTPKQQSVFTMLEEYGAATSKEICYVCNIGGGVVSNLVKKGWLEIYEQETSRSPTKDSEASASLSELIFSPRQQEVYDGLRTLMDCDEAKCALLRGVTGSGKTSVFIKLIEHALECGKTALLMVPEISLTPQMTGQFTRLFGNKVAIIHSNLSLGQRMDEYKRIQSGGARIVIGTRSAVFAPLDNIGVIVIDEEGEHTYKSERSPRYHARDVAKQRAFRHKAFLLLASATPSLESYYYAKSGRYALFELEERYSRAVLPDVYLVDMKIEAENGNRSNFSDILLEEIGANLEKGEQTLILLNRRGYHTYASCIACGAVVECPNCSIALTYHKSNQSVMCHCCGYSRPMPEQCPKCDSRYIHQSGTGTQRVEDELQELFPKARILRMDADTTISKTAFTRQFALFGEGEYDIMVGTQMIAKGLDFENVTLVGVLMIDKALYAGDYLGYEKTFSLVTQVVGRSGRGSKKGRAYIQTFSPQHYVLELAASQNYAEFYAQEIDVRQALIFPPFCTIFSVNFAAVAERSAHDAAREFIAVLRDHMIGQSFPLRVLGPTKSGTGRMNGKYRYKIIIKGKNTKQFRALLAGAQKKAMQLPGFRDVGLYIDINGEIT